MAPFLRCFSKMLVTKRPIALIASGVMGTTVLSRMWLCLSWSHILDKTVVPITPDAIKAMGRFVTSILEKHRKKGAICDSPMKCESQELPKTWKYDDLYVDYYY